jgi:hypothetical protein
VYKLISRTSINNQKEGKGIKMTAIANKEKVTISQKREYVLVVEPENQQRLVDSVQ